MHQHAWHSFHPWPEWCQHEVVPAWHRQHKRCTRQHGARHSVQAKANLRIRIFLASPIFASMSRDTHHTCAVYSRQGSRGTVRHTTAATAVHPSGAEGIALIRRHRGHRGPACFRCWPWQRRLVCSGLVHSIPHIHRVAFVPGNLALDIH
jgi:hypothetical protein